MALLTDVGNITTPTLTQRRLVALHQRLGSRGLVLASLFVSVAFSFGSTMLAMWISGLISDPQAMSVAVPTSIIVPALVAPVVTVTIVALMGRLEAMNAHLTALSRTDPLTGAANRRGFFGDAEQLFARRSGPGQILVGMIDIDEFKSLNDTLGHDRGDRALRDLAALIDAAIGESGLVGRLGGDEFAFVLQGEPSETATVRAQIFRTCSSFTIDGHVSVSSSIGISEVRPDDTVDLALSRADAELYRNKRARVAADDAAVSTAAR